MLFEIQSWLICIFCLYGFDPNFDIELAIIISLVFKLENLRILNTILIFIDYSKNRISF